MNRHRFALVVVVVAVVAVGIWAAWHFDLVRSASAESAVLVDSTFTPTMSGVEQTNENIAFYEARAADDPYGAGHRAMLASLHLQRSRLTGSLEDFREAETYARRSVELRTLQNTSGYRLLAASLLAQHRFADALEVAEELVEIWPRNPAHRALLGQIQLESGDYAAARETMEAIRGDSEDLSVAPRLAQWAELTGQPEDARALLYLAQQKAFYRTDLSDEQRAWFYLRVGTHELEHGRLEEAEKAFEAALAIEPNDFRVVSALARLEALRHNWEKAIHYGKLVKDNTDLATIALVGDAYAALGERDASEQYYALVERQARDNPEPFNRQLYWFRLAHDRRLPETLSILLRDIDMRRDVHGYDILAWALYKSGEYQAARTAMTQALHMGTLDAEMFFHAGMIERALGAEETARYYLEKALELNPHFHPTLPEIARDALHSLD